MRPLLLAAAFLLALTLVATPASADDLPRQDCHLLIVGPDVVYFLCYDTTDLDCPIYTVSTVGKESPPRTTCIG